MTPHLPRRIHAGDAWSLFDVATTRHLESLALARPHAPTLMQRAGLSAARLALALAPHARTVWVAAGPGNNGGDGLEAAAHLQRWGKEVVVSWLGTPQSASADTSAAYQHAREAGVQLRDAPPAHADLCIDALLGIGASRAPAGRMADWIGLIRRRALPVLSIDLPTGLDADTGQAADIHVAARATLCLLTLKPGLFTGQGRDTSETVWLDDLRREDDPPVAIEPHKPRASLAGAPATSGRRHASHKGSYGDVVVIGGAPGMAGAAQLAASAALHAGAGRVYLCPLDPAARATPALLPELMVRNPETAPLRQACVVCGCGGGQAVREVLPVVLAQAGALVLDADALNAVADDTPLRQLLRNRSARQARTVLTPHPLEAARLLGSTTTAVQQDRLRAAESLSAEFGCTVVLKGSGSVVARPGETSSINPTGNARLATAGSGDVLAGAIGAALAAGESEFGAAVNTVFRHGAAADRWPAGQALTASALARAIHAGSAGS